jgi:hypothetical protein
MSNDPKNIRLGPCRVRWGGKDIGLTKGGVDVELKTTTKQVQIDQFGNTPVDEYITGRELTVKTPFVESDIDGIYTMLSKSVTNFIDDGAKATGSFTFTAQPAANDTITVNGHVFTYVTVVGTGPGGALADQILIGSTQAVTMQNTATILSASADPLVQQATYGFTGTTVTVTYFKSGTVGNSFTLAKSGTTASTSGAALSGGTNATHRRLEVMSGVGVSLLATAQELLLHPQNRNDNDYSEDFVVPICNTSGAFTFAYRLDQERVFNLSFTGYPDPSSTRLFLYGNKW